VCKVDCRLQSPNSLSKLLTFGIGEWRRYPGVGRLFHLGRLFRAAADDFSQRQEDYSQRRRNPKCGRLFHAIRSSHNW